MENLGIAGVAALTVVCYLAGQAVKAAKIRKKWVNVVIGIFGMVIGVAAMYIMPDYPAEDPITAAAVGIVSSLAASNIRTDVKKTGDRT